MVQRTLSQGNPGSESVRRKISRYRKDSVMKKTEKSGKTRICGRCGCEEDQSKMVRVSKRLSDTGWLCEDCYEEVRYEDYEED